MKRVLIAGVGNVLRGDDGFGPAVVEALHAAGDLERARAVEVGTAGITLVHELMDEYEALIVVDCMRRSGPPGSIYVVEAALPDAGPVLEQGCLVLGADLHDLGVDRALIVARAAGVLPPRVWLVGCEPAEVDELQFDLSPPVRAALPQAVESIRQLIGSLTLQGA